MERNISIEKQSKKTAKFLHLRRHLENFASTMHRNRSRHTTWTRTMYEQVPFYLYNAIPLLITIDGLKTLCIVCTVAVSLSNKYTYSWITTAGQRQFKLQWSVTIHHHLDSEDVNWMSFNANNNRHCWNNFEKQGVQETGFIRVSRIPCIVDL